MRKNSPMQNMQIVMYISQFGLCIAVSLVGSFWGANYLQNKFGLGMWIYVLALILGFSGVVGTFISLYKFYNTINKK